MANSSFVCTAFVGGEISQAAQGRMDLPAYKLSMNVCLNGIPIESGAWLRRPGTRHVVPTRGGARGRLIPFSFTQNYPYVMEFTDGFLRFTTGPALVMTNDQQTIAAISNANPAVVQTASAHGWTTGNSVAFNSLGVNNPLLQNRQFKITSVDATHFSIADAITGASIDGSTLGAFSSGKIARILEIATTYNSGSWSSLRSVQAETRTVLLNGAQPQVLQVATPPTATQFATFTLGASDFLDGPYLDPVTNAPMTVSGTGGTVTLTLSSAAGVNSGRGFLASDVGRLVRIFSEPPLWSSSQNYSANQVVAYADGNGGYNYWTATGNISAGVQPGTSGLWALNATGAIWSWVQIASISGLGLLTATSFVGSLTGGGGISSAFDGNTSKSFASAANFTQNAAARPAWSVGVYNSGAIVLDVNSVAYTARFNIYPNYSAQPWVANTIYNQGQVVLYNNFVYQANVAITNFSTPPPSNSQWNLLLAISTGHPKDTPSLWLSGSFFGSPTFDVFIGQHNSAANAIQFGVFYPTADVGIGNTPANSYVITMRAGNSQPTSASDGVVLGTVVTSNMSAPVTVQSGDQSTKYNFVWFEIIATFPQPLPDDGSHNYICKIGAAQAQFFGVSASNLVATANFRGPNTLYNQPIRTWRMGLYSDTTGWPTCGTYHEGRVWFGGVVSNRFDAGVSNGISGNQLNFAPTSPNGDVLDSSAISYICNGKDVNQILWMEPDQQGILFGTQAGEWLISAPSQGALSPTNIKAVRVTRIGCANIEPRRSEHTLLFVQRYSRKVMEYFADVYSGKFSAPNLTERSKHLTVSGIAEVAYQQELAPIFWMRRNDGQLIGAIYKRDTLTTSQGPTIIGHHRHQLGSGRLVESIAAGPSQGGNLDALSMITNDPNTGIRHIELMTDLLDEGFSLTDCWFLDDGIVPSSTVIQASTTPNPYGSLLVNGLSVHNGKTVTAYIAGLDCGDYLVANGSITVPFGDGVSVNLPNGLGTGLFTQALVQSFTNLPAVIGFTYNSDGQLVRPVAPADTGAQAGTGFAKIGRAHKAAALVYGMVNGSIAFGTDFSALDPAKLTYANDVPYPVNVQWSGIWRDVIESDLSFDSMIAWRINRPNPAFVMAIGGFDSKADI